MERVSQSAIVNHSNYTKTLLTSHPHNYRCIVQYYDKDGTKKWKCNWCGHTFMYWNATKALYHAAKQPKGDVRKCTSKAIDADHQELYRNLFDQYKRQQNSLRVLKESKRRASDVYMAEAGEALSAKKRTKNSPVDTSPTVTPTSDLTGTDTSKELFTDADNNENNRLHQQKLGFDVHGESKLTMAIADLIHSCGLPFSLASHHKFKRVLEFSKFASKKYSPPGRNKVAGELLDLNYEIYQKKMFDGLLKEASVYGISFFGDGATVRKSPLINILASSVHLPVGCLSIVDCSGHLESDGRKDATYICNLFLPHITKMEVEAPKSTDLVIFNGASNVQKAGLLLEAQFPHLSVIHGAEHVISLFYHDVFRLREFEMLKNFNRLIYRYFGSGSMHSPYAIFSKHSRDHNNGKCIGLIRAADTRMAGHVISMLRTLRLREPLISTISSASFLQGKVKVSKAFTVTSMNLSFVTNIECRLICTDREKDHRHFEI